jgi:hypothetical protein
LITDAGASGSLGGDSYFVSSSTLSTSASGLPTVSGIIGSPVPGGNGGNIYVGNTMISFVSNGEDGACEDPSVTVPTAGASNYTTSDVSSSGSWEGGDGGSSSVNFCSGAAGGVAAISLARNMTDVTITVTGGNGGDGGIGASGGAGGHGFVQEDLSPEYTNVSITFTGGNGGNGGDGIVRIWTW